MAPFIPSEGDILYFSGHFVFFRRRRSLLSQGDVLCFTPRYVFFFVFLF